MQLWFSPLLTLALAATTVVAQDPLNNFVGTWSSGSRAVTTGAGFANPANMTFTYPKNTGVAYSFSKDGFYEISRYRFVGNGSMPTCITGVLQWVHGNYTKNDNGTITCVPFGDGFQQIQDPCAAQSNFVDTNYNFTEIYSQWQIFQDPVAGYKLHLWQQDGTPVSPLFQIATSPNMLPTTVLRSAPKPATTSDGLISSRKRGIPRAKRSTWGWGL